MIKTALNIAGLHTGPTLTTLIFHRVLPAADSLMPDEPDAKRFTEMMRWLASWFNVVPLDTAIDALKAQSLPPRALAITFDDGYADNWTVAAPILKNLGLHATFFIATGFLDGGRMWNDTVIESIRAARSSTFYPNDIEALRSRGLGELPITTESEKRSAIAGLISAIKHLPPEQRLDVTNQIAKQCSPSRLPENLMMSTAQLLELRNAGFGIGAHTCNHPILAAVDSDAARLEIAASRAFLEKTLQQPVDLFAYPNGKPNADYRLKDRDIVAELGFKAAVTTAWGVADNTTDVLQLPRFTPWDREKYPFGLRLIRNALGNKAAKPRQRASH